MMTASTARAQSTQPAAPRQRLSLDRGWRFHLGDVQAPVIRGHESSYDNAKTGRAWGAAAPEHDDSDWRELDLPHDWVVEGPFDEKENVSQGYRPRGIAWYRRYFKLDPSDSGKHIELQFDGIATHCTIWVNGVIAHRNFCGYTSSYIDITPFAKFGDDFNTIAVRVDANPQEGWWYEGGGIYRHAWLVKRSAVHIATDGVYANPARDASGNWSIPLEVKLESAARKPANVEIVSTLIDPDGKEIGTATAETSIDPLQESIVKSSIAVTSPRLWSVDEPTLYRVRTVVKQDGNVVDEVVTTCSFRTIRFDADKGFFLNDQPLKIKGVCNHQDHAGVGVAVPDALWDFRVKKLKEMGANAYRCAHNPPAAEFLDACDRLGLLVMDENRNFNTTPEYLRQLEWMVRRDRNHPSIILWSIFNEEPMQATERGYEMVRRMSAAVKRLDVTRPVTAAQNNGMLATVNASQAADVGGFNYRHNEYDRYHEANPTKSITSSEDTSAVMTRGEYATVKDRAVLSSYDDEWRPWGLSHRRAWKEIGTRPFIAGGFVWTGFDYRGEPQPLVWPSTGSSFGCMDLCGFPKTAFYIHQAQWITDKAILKVFPHWNWPGHEGKTIKVFVPTNAESVALVLNGKPIAEKSVDKYEMVMFDVPYEAGKLEAIGKKNGAEVARDSVETTGEPVALQLVPDRTTMAGDGCDALPITVQALDDQGRPVPTANLSVEFEVSGPGAIIGLGNGDPTCHEPEKGNKRSLFNGLAQVIVQSAADRSGELRLIAKAANLKPAETTIGVAPAPSRPSVPIVVPPQTVRRWRVSPTTNVSPDPNQQLSDTDMNNWPIVESPRPQRLNDGKYVMYRATFTPRPNVQQSGGRLVFHNLAGTAEVWLDGKLAGKKESPQRGNLTVALPPGTREHTMSVIFEADGNRPTGFGGTVTIEE